MNYIILLPIVLPIIAGAGLILIPQKVFKNRKSILGVTAFLMLISVIPALMVIFSASPYELRLFNLVDGISMAARIGPLERDAAKARKYLELYDAKKRTDVALWLYDADAYTENIKKAERDTRMSAHELEMAEDSRKQTEDRIDSLYEKSHANKEESQSTHEAYNTAAGQKAVLEGEVQVAQTEKKHKVDRIAAENAAMAAAETEKKSAAARLEELNCRKTETDALYRGAETDAEKAQEAVSRYTSDRRAAGELLESLLTTQKQKESAVKRLKLSIKKN